MPRTRLLVMGATGIVAVGLLAGAGVLFLGPARASIGPLPAAALVLPADTRFVMSVDVKRLAESELYRRAGRDATRIRALAELEARTGLSPERDVDQLIVAGLPAEAGASRGVILVLGQFDRNRLERTVAQRAGLPGRDHRGTQVYDFGPAVLPKASGPARADPGGEGAAGFVSAVAILDGRTVALGSRAAVEAAIDGRADDAAPLRSNGSLMKLLERVRPGATFWMVGDRSLLAQLPGLLAGASASLPVQSLPVLQSLIVTGDLDPGISLELIGDAADEAGARQLANVASGLAALLTFQAAQRPELQQLAQAISVTTETSHVRVSARVSYELLDALLPKPLSGGTPATDDPSPPAPAPTPR